MPLRIGFSLLILVSTIGVSVPGYAAEREALSKIHEVQKDYETFGREFAQALNDRSMEDLRKLFDCKAYAEEVAKRVLEKPSERNEFVKGFLAQGEDRLLARLFTLIFQKEVSVKYMRTIRSDGATKPLLRIDIFEGGHEYVSLIVRKENNNLAAKDMFLASSGKLSSEAVAAGTQLLLAREDSMIARMLGFKRINEKLVGQFKQIGTLREQGKYREAYDLVSSLPEDIRTNRVMLDAALTLSQFVSDEEYRKQLGLLAKYHGDDESTAFMLIDHYYYEGDYAKAQASIDRMISSYGEDAALLNLKANMALAANDAQSAARFCRKAINIEPEFEDAYWSLVTVLNTGRAYADMVEVFKLLEANLGYEFSPADFTQEEFYSGFIKSAAFKKWWE